MCTVYMETEPIENFCKLVIDMLQDVESVFPEFKDTVQTLMESCKEDKNTVYSYAMGVIPPRFFDILYHNDDMFSDEGIDTQFLPGLDFAHLFNAEGVSDNTKDQLWKYLQLILLSMVEGVKDKSEFGDCADLFSGINEDELHEKMKEAFEGVGEMFDNEDEEGDQQEEGEEKEGESSGRRNPGGIPNIESLQEHLKFVFEGKIGTLAKELTQEMKEELSDLIGDDGENANPKEAFKRLVRNPKRIQDLIKKLTARVEEKVKSGNISKEELMTEAKEIMGKMNEFGGKDKFMNMMKGMAKSVGGKGAKFNMGAFEKMAKQGEERERLLKKLEERKKTRIVEENNKKTFTIAGEEQEKSQREYADKIINELIADDEMLPPPPKTKSKPKSKTKSKKSKSKK